jgi:hypothetical protein
MIMDVLRPEDLQLELTDKLRVLVVYRLTGK